MGCGASALAGPAGTVGQRPGKPRDGPTGADVEELRATWAAIAGSADRALDRVQLRLVFEQLGRTPSDAEFEAAFRCIDASGSATVEFGEFVAVYREQSVAEQKQIRALKVEAELKRRLASGKLSPEQEEAVSARLGAAADGVVANRPPAVSPLSPGAADGAPEQPAREGESAAAVGEATEQSEPSRPPPAPAASGALGAASESDAAWKAGGRLEKAHLAYVDAVPLAYALAATGPKSTAREGSLSSVELYRALKGVYGGGSAYSTASAAGGGGTHQHQGPGAKLPPRPDLRADGSSLWMTEEQVESSSAVEDHTAWQQEAAASRRFRQLAGVREITWELLDQAMRGKLTPAGKALQERFALAELEPEPEPEPEGDAFVISQAAAELVAMVGPELVAQLREVFDKIDKNHDGSLTRAELIIRLRKDEEVATLLQVHLPQNMSDAGREQFEAVFQGMDSNDDREVDAEEFIRFFARRHMERDAAGGEGDAWLPTQQKPEEEVLALADDPNALAAEAVAPEEAKPKKKEKKKGGAKKKKKR